MRGAGPALAGEDVFGVHVHGRRAISILAGDQSLEERSLDDASRTGGLGVAYGAVLGTAMLLMWVIGAVGLIGAEGDPFDLLYGGVIGVAVVGALVARFRPAGTERALYWAAVAQCLVVVVALILGKQHHPVSSTPEIVLSNGFFVALWVGSARLFRRARTSG